jgi:hypothetical protein
MEFNSLLRKNGSLGTWIRYQTFLLISWSLFNPGELYAMPIEITSKVTSSEAYMEYSKNNTSVHVDNANDYVTTLTPSIRVDYNPSLYRSYLQYSIERFWYVQRTQFDYFRQQAETGLARESLRGSAAITGSYLSYNSDDSEVLFNGSIYSPQTHIEQENGGLRLAYHPVQQSLETFDYGYLETHYSASSVQLFTLKSHTADASQNYDFSLLDSIALKERFNRTNYLSSASSYLRSTAQTELDWKHHFGRFTLFDAAAGYGVSSGHIQAWLVDLRMKHDFQSASLEGEIGRSLDSGNVVAGTTVVTQQGTVTVQKSITRETSLNLKGTIGNSTDTLTQTNYDIRFWNLLFNWEIALFLHELTGSLSGNYGESNGQQTGVTSDNSYWNGTIGVKYAMSRWLGATLNASRFVYQSTNPLVGTAQTDQIFLTLYMDFSPWRPIP